MVKNIWDLPIKAADGNTVPLGELGHFAMTPEDPIIYRKDLRPMEYVVGEMAGRLGAPIYGMLAVEDLLKGYETPDGAVLSGTLTGAPESSTRFRLRMERRMGGHL